MSWFGPCPEYGYPDYCPPYEVQEAPFKNPESLSKAQKRLVRLAQEKVVDQIICGDDERRLAGWQIMHVTIKNHAHQPGRYELVGRPRRDSAPNSERGDTAKRCERPGARQDIGLWRERPAAGRC